MGEKLVQRITAGLAKMNWDGEPMSTPLGIQTYEMALDILNEFSGDVKVLDHGIKRIRAGDSRPYRMAGVAYLLLVAARSGKGLTDYAASGLTESMGWLEKAQQDEPDLADINFVEGRIYLHSGQLDNTRMIQDYLLEQAPYHYHVLLTEAMYWQELGDLDQMNEWYAAAARHADNVPKKVGLYERIGDAYIEHGRLEDAIEQFKKSLHFSRETGRLWHKLSELYLQQDDIEACKHANERALEFGVGAPAQEMQMLIKRRLGTTGMLRRFLGIF